MKLNRRNLLKIGGLSIVALAAKPVISLFTGNRDLLLSETIEKKEEAKTSLQAVKRWAMAVDVSKCKDGCKDCINICHQIHNVPSIDNPKHEVKWIWTDSFKNVFPTQENELVGTKLKEKPFEVLCNHCENPACVRVCPTKATWQRDDGVVMMDYHRCIGCRFCMAACPYGSRSFNWKDPRLFLKEENITKDYPTRTKGVVEKCNFCAERLDIGKIPACAEACKQRALVFGDMNDENSEIRKLLTVKYAIRRKPGLGTGPQIYYIV